MNSEKLLELKKLAAEVRLGAVEAVYNGKSGHPGGALSAADVITYLYFSELNINPDDPKNPDRDRFILSKGHSCPALYTAMALRGYFDISGIKSFRHLGALMQGHPDMKTIPGIDMSAGSLGQGFSCACGMALAGKINSKDYRTYVMIGDGESQEGQIWEATMFASHYKLDNLCLIIDNNGLQIDGRVEDVMNPMPYESKFEAFGWNVITIDGHDMTEIASAFENARSTKGKPSVIIAKTVKGKGVSFMEYAQAVKELTEYKNALN